MSGAPTTDALTKELLLAAGEEAPPRDLSFGNLAVVRNPWLWILVFEKRNLNQADFRTPDRTSGPATLAFRECAVRAFSLATVEPHHLPPALHTDLEMLVAAFSSVGALFCLVPLGTDECAAALDVVEVLRAAVEHAESIIRRMTEVFLSAAGGSGEHYRLSRVLDPLSWPTADREAIRRATTRRESFLPQNQSQKRPREAAPSSKRICRRCKEVVPPTTHWREHLKVCTRASK